MSHLTIPSELEATRQIQGWLETLDLDSFDIARIELALVELSNNIIQHGYQKRRGEIRFESLSSSFGATFIVADDAPQAELPEEGDMPEAVQVHGYGLHIIKQLVENFGYNRINESNEWTLEFAPKTLKSKSDAARFTVVPSDRLDVVSAPALRDELTGALEAGARKIVVDLSNTDFCDSAGLAALVAGMRQARSLGGDLEIVKPENKTVWEIFELTQFDKVFSFAKAVK